MELRDYQKDAVAAAWRSARQKKNSVLVLPTGAGKSIILAQLCRDAISWGARAIVLAHRKELLEQNAEKIDWLGCPVGVYSAGLGRRDTEQDVIVAGIQSVYRKATHFGRRQLLIVDECHRINAKDEDSQYSRFVKKLRKCNPDLIVVGLSATPFRTGEGEITDGGLFDEIAYEAKIDELIAQGFLCPVVNRTARHAVNMSGVAIRGGEFVQRQMEDAFLGNVDEVCHETVVRCRGQQSIVIFTSGVAHAERVSELIGHETGEDVGLVTGDTLPLVRESYLRQFKAGKLRWMVNVNILTEGFDSPRIDTVVMMRATCSPGLFCLDDETEILTKDGWKGHDYIKSKSPDIAAFDNGTIKWEQATGTIKREVMSGEKMVEFESPYLSFRVTEDHRMIYKKSRRGKFVESTAKEMIGRANSLIPLCGIQDSPGCGLSDDDMFLVGLVIADGHVSKTGAVIISQAATQPWISEIDALLCRLGYKFTRTQRKRKHHYKTGEETETIYWTISTTPRRPNAGSYSRPEDWEPAVKYASHLLKYKDKENVIHLLDKATKKEIASFLKGLDLGDGAKPRNINWEKKTYDICLGVQGDFASRMQSALVRKGFKCNLAVSKVSAWHKKPQYTAHIRDKEFIGISSDKRSDRNQIKTTNPAPGEIVWCVEVPSGAFLSRRKGKVCVLGNCQAVGRGFRVHESKAVTKVIDFGGNIERHGPLDSPGFGRNSKKGGGSGEAPVKACEKCGKEHPIAARECDCGFLFPEPEPQSLNETPDEKNPILMGEPVDFTVVSVHYYMHTKRDDPESRTLRVDYRLPGLDRISEWVCIEHTGYARQKACSWWMDHANTEPPLSVEEALDLADAGALRKPVAIKAKKEGKFWRIVSRTFDCEKPINWQGINTEEIPF